VAVKGRVIRLSYRFRITIKFARTYRCRSQTSFHFDPDWMPRDKRYYPNRRKSPE
jgi:hypothetical protein